MPEQPPRDHSITLTPTHKYQFALSVSNASIHFTFILKKQTKKNQTHTRKYTYALCCHQSCTGSWGNSSFISCEIL